MSKLKQLQAQIERLTAETQFKTTMLEGATESLQTCTQFLLALLLKQGGAVTLTQADYQAVLGMRVEREEDADGSVVLRAATGDGLPQQAQH